jgi:lipid II:glycine glycyltransferase (peptidoglycan interpeptide bridge formation enzyme)
MENDCLIKGIFEVNNSKENSQYVTESFLQSAMWGQFKSSFGWQAKVFLIEWNIKVSCKEEKSPLLVISRRLAPGFSFAYIPFGPELPQNFPVNQREKALADLAGKLKPYISRNTAFIRFDPPWLSTQNDVQTFNSLGFKRAAVDVQPPNTVYIDLELSCDEILKSMKPKTRYNIVLAGKHGVTINCSDCRQALKNDNPLGLKTFYKLLKDTAERDKIAIHSYDYYKTLFEIFGGIKHPENTAWSTGNTKLYLFTASHEDDILASIVVLFKDKYATYLYGASSNVKRNLMASYSLQWKVIQDAKDAGCKYYDLFGIPPDDNPNHPMAGLYRFKTGFGGQIIKRPGSWDYPLRPVVYRLFRNLESLRGKLRKKLRNRKKSK